MPVVGSRSVPVIRTSRSPPSRAPIARARPDRRITPGVSSVPPTWPMLSIGTPIIVRIPVIRVRRYHTVMDAIDLVAEFLNTYDLETGVDGLATADGLSAWAAEHGVMAAGAWVSPQDAAAARELREALRTTLETGGRDTADLDAAAARLPLVALPGEGGRMSLVSARGGPDDVRAAVLEAVLAS